MDLFGQKIIVLLSFPGKACFEAAGELPFCYTDETY